MSSLGRELSTWLKENVLAICTADWHLQLTPPIWRSNEPDWLDAMARPINEIKSLQHRFDCSVFIVGDIFDKWNSSPELINWAIDNMPLGVCAIAGQHDLPYHSLKDIHKSAFATLIKADNIQYTSALSCPYQINEMIIYGYNYGCTIKIPEEKSKELKVAIAHQYVWIDGCNYQNAPNIGRVGRLEKQLTKYDVVIFGDNHIGFLMKIGKTTIFNCGSLMRRHSDQIDYTPMVGLLLSTGQIIPYFLDISSDKYLEIDDNSIKGSNTNFKEFFSELEKLGDTGLDFEEAVIEYIKKKKPGKVIEKLLIEAMESKK